MKKIIGFIRETFNDKLRYLCALLSPENRLVIVLVLLLLGAVMNTYFMFYTISHWSSSKDTDKHAIDHIEAVKTKSDKTGLIQETENIYNYETEEFNEEAR